jgi:acetyl-CoA carboxylase biotin carboxyl carrier protein
MALGIVEMNIKDIEKLAKILENSVIAEIEITDFWGRKVRLNKTGGVVHTVKATDRSITGAEVIAEEQREKPAPELAAIKSPIVGTFYRAPAPDAPPYVEVGDTVKPGQVVCIVEAMKLMNEIESDVVGKIAQILVKNEDPVEYNQVLMLVEPI